MIARNVEIYRTNSTKSHNGPWDSFKIYELCSIHNIFTGKSAKKKRKKERIFIAGP